MTLRKSLTHLWESRPGKNLSDRKEWNQIDDTVIPNGESSGTIGQEMLRLSPPFISVRRTLLSNRRCSNFKPPLRISASHFRLRLFTAISARSSPSQLVKKIRFVKWIRKHWTSDEAMLKKTLDFKWSRVKKHRTSDEVMLKTLDFRWGRVKEHWNSDEAVLKNTGLQMKPC
jgi:hypothetical protein